MTRLARVVEAETVTVEFDAVRDMWKVFVVVNGVRLEATGADLAVVADVLATSLRSQ